MGSPMGIQHRYGVVTSKGALLFITAVLFLWTLFRGFRLPIDYAVGHWILSYDQGFIKRGLVGSLISPLFQYKSPYEIRLVIQGLSTAVLFALAAALMYVARKLLDRTREERLLFLLPLAVFATSSFPIVAAGLNGFFDHFLELLTLAGLGAVFRRRYLIIPVLCMTALAVHEIFLVYGFPVLCFALLLRLHRDLQVKRVTVGRAGFVFGIVLLPTVLFYGAIQLAQLATPPEQLEALGEAVGAMGLFPPNTVQNMVLFHLHKNLADNYMIQSPDSFLNRLLNPGIALEVFPTTLYLFGWVVALLVRGRNARMILPATGAIAAPLAAHLVAWDTHRFANFTILHAFLVLFSVAAILPTSYRLGRHFAVGALVLFFPVVVHNVVETVHIDGLNTESDCIFAMRRAPTLQSFDGRPPLFPNSNFEKGNLFNWKVTGLNALRRPKSAVIKAPNHRIKVVQGSWWYGSYAMEKRDGVFLGDRPQGEMVSVPFVIRHDKILFLVAGGNHPEQTYVALEVAGEEVYRETGKNDDLFRPIAWDVRRYAGKQAVIRIVDRHSGHWGHINVDGFCYFPG